MRTAFLLVLVLLAAPALADDFLDAGLRLQPPSLPGESTTVAVYLQATDTKEPVSESHLVISLLEPITWSTLAYVGEAGEFAIALPQTGLLIEIRADRVDTPGKDYYYRGPLSPTRAELHLPVYPVGSVTGVVKDASGELVSGAYVDVRCAGDYGVVEGVKSDEFGRYAFEWLPTGSCFISASHRGAIGYAEVTVERGMLKNVPLALDKRVTRTKLSLWHIIILLIVLLIILLVLRRKAPVHLSREKPPERLAQRTKDVMETLKATEKAVVEYLLKHDGAYQNRVMRATSIPKTTLIRVIDSLEKKRIIYTIREGKIKRLQLTDWFRGK
ncbi:hypothetical protein D6789_02180 [Candidatus Woesearchaeota archaeon]|nr:MAG: hypothetical protein D6789_02180 [Candidatus Woesearchaeota archaeon]